MWQGQSHVLAPFTKLTSINRKFKLTEVEQDAINKIKRIMARATLLTYPDFNETFKTHADASALQLGAVIIHKVKHIDFYSRKLTGDQQRYTLTDIELLSIVDTLKDFRTNLLGQKLLIYTDNKNLTFKNNNIDRVLRWRLILEEYGPDIEYIRGENIIVSDERSRIPLNGNQDTIQKSNYQQEIVS